MCTNRSGRGKELKSSSGSAIIRSEIHSKCPCALLGRFVSLLLQKLSDLRIPSADRRQRSTAAELLQVAVRWYKELASAGWLPGVEAKMLKALWMATWVVPRSECQQWRKRGQNRALSSSLTRSSYLHPLTKPPDKIPGSA